MMAARRSNQLWTMAAIFCAAFGALGWLVSHSSPGYIDQAAANIGGDGSLTAWYLTISGFFPTQALIAAVLIASALITRRHISEAFAASIALLAAQIAIMPAKTVFHRVRPIHWFVRHEYTLSYPSGHAATAIAFLGILAYFVWRSALPKWVRSSLATLLIAWVLAISCSRIALGAHYLTDVIGGWLIGAACLCATLAAYGGMGQSTGQAADRPRSSTGKLYA